MEKFRKTHLVVISFIFILAMGTTVVFATTTTASKSLGLFEHVDDNVNLKQYVNHMNNISEKTATVKTEAGNLFVKNTIFTDHYVYAIIGLQGNGSGVLNVSGNIIYPEVDQAIYGLTGEIQEIQQEDGVRYFYYTGKITYTGDPSRDKQIRRAANNQFLKFNRLADVEGSLLEFNVNLDGDNHLLTTQVTNVYTETLVFSTDTNLYKGDFYDTVTLTPYELKLKGKSESLRLADEKEWKQPHFHITIVRKGKPDLHMKYDTRGSISDEGFPLGMSRGHSSDTGEFYHHWNFRDWELDLNEVSAIIIDGETYRVEK